MVIRIWDNPSGRRGISEGWRVRDGSREILLRGIPSTSSRPGAVPKRLMMKRMGRLPPSTAYFFATWAGTDATKRYIA